MAVQRTWHAPCPGCGAPVSFRGAQAAAAICSHCHSTLVRDGATLQRIGRMAELFEDHSPLQLQARGAWQDRAMRVVGRLQHRGASGAWNVWQLLFEDGEAAWLVEDRSGWALAWPADPGRQLPAPEHFRLGADTAFGGKTYQVTLHEPVAVVAAEGELPRAPALQRPATMVQLRSADSEVLWVDYAECGPRFARGRVVSLAELRFTGLREDSTRQAQARQLACPACGAQLAVQLADSVSIVCRGCAHVVDLRRGLAGALAHALEAAPARPRLPLGAAGRLQGVAWQLVGFQRRLGTDPQQPGVQVAWDEYLLYNRRRGFAALLDADAGWSFARPLASAPRLSSSLLGARYFGRHYTLASALRVETSEVAGEFPWPVERGMYCFRRSYAAGRRRLWMEEVPQARHWWVASAVDGDAVALAFGAAQGPRPRGAGCASVFALLLLLAAGASAACWQLWPAGEAGAPAFSRASAPRSRRAPPARRA